MEKSKRSSLIKRVLTSVILAPLVVAAVLSGWDATAVMVLSVSALLAWEWAGMVPNKNNTVYALSYFFAAACSIFFANVSYSLTIMAGTALFVWFKAKGEEHRRLLTFGVPYITLGIGSLIWLFVIFGDIVTLWFIVAVWCVDIGGYLVGSTLKGPKLAPSISPNKTWSGLFGAIAFSVLASMLVSYWFSRGEYVVFASIGAVLAVVAQCGDLLESKIKRYLQIKDSSNLIPGHGGMFDRVDGLLFAAPFMLAIFLFFVF